MTSSFFFFKNKVIVITYIQFIIWNVIFTLYQMKAGAEIIYDMDIEIIMIFFFGNSLILPRK